MRTGRHRYPPRGRLCTIATAGRRTFLSVGDLMDAIPRSPWTQVMDNTPRTMHNSQRFVELGHARRWVKELTAVAGKEQATGLERFLDWAEVEADAIRTNDSI